MALNDLERYLIFNTHNHLWQQDMLMNAYFRGSSVGANLREMMIGRPPVQPLTNPFDEAITGQLRSDSRAIRRNAANVQEAAQVMGVASEAVSTMKTVLEEMEELLKKIKEERDLYYDDEENQNNGDPDGTFETSDANKEDYKSLKNRLTSIIESTTYNSIPLLDGSQWPGTEQIDDDGNIFIKGLPGRDNGFNITFRDLDSMQWDELDESELDDNNGNNVENQLELVSDLLGDITLTQDLYSSRKSSLEFQSASLESQADLLDQAVEARRQTPTLSLEEILVDLLLRYSGNIMNQIG